MAETEKQKQEKAEPNDAVFVIRYTYAGNREKVEDGRIINGKNVENRVIDFLKEKKNKKKLDIKINVNYKPSQRFLDFQKDFVRTRQEYIGWVNVCFGSEDEIDETADGTVVITMTELDYDELKKYLDQIEYLYL